MGFRKIIGDLVINITTKSAGAVTGLKNTEVEARKTAAALDKTAQSSAKAESKLDRLGKKIDSGPLGSLNRVGNQIRGIATGIAGLVATLAAAAGGVASLNAQIKQIRAEAESADRSLGRLARTAGAGLESMFAGGGDIDTGQSSLIRAARAERDALNDEYVKTLEAIDAQRDGIRRSVLGIDGTEFSIPFTRQIGEEEAKQARDRALRDLDRGNEKILRAQVEARNRAREENEIAADRLRTEARIAALRAEGKESDALRAEEDFRRRSTARRIADIGEVDRALAAQLTRDEKRRQDAWLRTQNERVMAELNADKNLAEEKARIARELADKEAAARLQAIQKETDARLATIRRLENEERRRFSSLFDDLTASVGTFSDVSGARQGGTRPGSLNL
jgi:hypothetical protein